MLADLHFVPFMEMDGVVDRPRGDVSPANSSR